MDYNVGMTNYRIRPHRITSVTDVTSILD